MIAGLPRSLSRALLLVLAVLGSFVATVGTSYAQSASCAQLASTLRSLERNPDFRNFQSGGDLRGLQRELQRSESRYVRDGCNDDARARRPLSSSCRALARDILSLREQLERRSASSNTGNAVAQQREAVLQEMARFGCRTGGSSVEQARRPANIFEQLFGGGGFNDGDTFRESDDYDYFDGQQGYNTVRTVCVRACDGYFWPVSYSTLPDYAWNDAQQCQAQCPGTPVELYTYSNPGQEPEQMVSLSGVPYSSSPNAFRYRREFDRSCTCQKAINYGQINLAESSGGQSRAVIQFGELSFPLPMRDPRRPANVVEAAPVAAVAYVSVPLPRRRPAAPGEAPPPVPVTPVATAPDLRIVRFGDKEVRIVGPNTPYAPSAATGL